MSGTLAPILTDFDRLGGAPTVARLVDAFYHHMDTAPGARALRAIHKPDLTETKAVLRRYLGEWLGGPPLYSQERGHPRLRMRHIRFSIGPAERDAWMGCMDAALAEVVPDAAVRVHLHDAFLKLADWLRNDPENPHDHR